MENMEYPKMVMQATVIGLILLTICVIVMAHLERKFREMLKPKHNSKENCNMKNSCFSLAVFFVTDIADCDMDEDDFTEASFYKASISDCQMNKAILDEVTFCEMVLERCDLANAYGSVLLAGIDSKMIDCKHVALCTDAVKLEVFDKDELIATSYKTALFA